MRSSTDDLLRHILFAQAMLPSYAERFRGLGDEELDALADSFSLASCVRRERLCDLVAAHTRGVAQPLKTVSARNLTALGSCALIRIVSHPRTPTATFWPPWSGMIA